MNICTSCGKTQASGKFCVACGSPTAEQSPAAATAATVVLEQPQQPAAPAAPSEPAYPPRTEAPAAPPQASYDPVQIPAAPPQPYTAPPQTPAAQTQAPAVKAKKKIPVLLIIIPILVILLAAGGFTGYKLVLEPANQYKAAVASFEDKEYQDAINTLKKLKTSYKDVKELLPYYQAYLAYSDKEYDDAADMFETLGTYADSVKMLGACRYEQANVLMSKGRYKDAAEKYFLAGSYKDAEDKYKECVYNVMYEFYNNGDYESAIIIAEKIPGYQNTDSLIIECRYYIAQNLYYAGNYEEAIEAFNAIADNYDVSYYLNYCYYSLAEQREEEGDFEAAYEFFMLTNYYDSQDRANNALYNLAVSCMGGGEYDRAEEMLIQLGDYGNSKMLLTRLYPTTRQKVIDMTPYYTYSISQYGELFIAGNGAPYRTYLYNVKSISAYEDIVAVLFDTGYVSIYTCSGDLYLDLSELGYDFTDMSIAYGTIALLRQNGTVVTYDMWESGIDYTAANSWSNIAAISSGLNYIVGLKYDGTLVGAGNDVSGALNFGSWTDIVAISSAEFHTVGLKRDGTVVACGGTALLYEDTVNERNSDFGQLNVSAWRNVISIDTGTYTTVAVLADGTVVSCGADSNYEIFNEDGSKNIIGISNNQTATEYYSEIVGAYAGAFYTILIDKWGNAYSIGDYGYNTYTDSDGYNTYYYHNQGQTSVYSWTVMLPY